MHQERKQSTGPKETSPNFNPSRHIMKRRKEHQAQVPPRVRAIKTYHGAKKASKGL